MSTLPSRSVSTRGPAGRNGRRQTAMSKMRSVRARMGASGGPASKGNPGNARHPASALANEACISPRRLRRPACSTFVLLRASPEDRQDDLAVDDDLVEEIVAALIARTVGLLEAMIVVEHVARGLAVVRHLQPLALGRRQNVEGSFQRRLAVGAH